MWSVLYNVVAVWSVLYNVVAVWSVLQVGSRSLGGSPRTWRRARMRRYVGVGVGLNVCAYGHAGMCGCAVCKYSSKWM